MPWPERFPDLSPIEYVWDMMKPELILSREPANSIAELRQLVHDAWDNLSQDDIRHLYDCVREYMPALLPEWGTLHIDVSVLTLLL